jgi:uncharacterized membrane protein YvbJ
MFCPNCGANNSTEQKFCRSCGLNLEKSAESLIEQIPNAQSENLIKQTQLIERFGNFALGGFGIVLVTAVSAIVYVIFEKMILTGANVLTGILLIAFLIFAILSLIFVFFNESLKEKKAKTNPALADELAGAKDTSKLLEEKHFEPSVPSVTENSTELLFAENKTRKIK